MKFEILVVLAVLATPSLGQYDPNCKDDRRAITHLFEWRWDDIAAECERFLAPKGYCGVQVSPPNENAIVMTKDVKRPWYERYQPISYKLVTRSGDEAGFIDMVTRCNNVGVRIYVDAVINHMSGADAGKSKGTGGSEFDANTLSFPAVPFTADDFHNKDSCPTKSGNIENYGDAKQVRNCRLVALLDLDHSKKNVQDKIIDYMNRLVRIGVAGFRIDAVKHMWPEDLKNILPRVETLNTTWFPNNTKPFIYQEVIDYGGEGIKSADYFELGRVTEFNYGKHVTKAFRNQMQLKNLKTFGATWDYMMPDDKALVFIDNHDNQRGHGGGGTIATFWESRLYKMCITYMLSWPYGVAQVMSSYRWNRNFQHGEDLNNWVGPPTDGDYNTKKVVINADDTCNDGWVCEHRWRQIYNMVKFRNVAGSEPVANWWDDGDNQIAFSRGAKAFYTVNASPWKNMDQTLFTGLPEGRYCDVISGNISADKKSCTGAVITVGGDKKARFNINSKQDDPMIAIHVEAKLV